MRRSSVCSRFSSRIERVQERRRREQLMAQVPPGAQAHERVAVGRPGGVLLVRVREAGHAAEVRLVAAHEGVADAGVHEPPPVDAREAVALPAEGGSEEEAVGQLVVVPPACVVPLGRFVRVRDDDVEVAGRADGVPRVGGGRARADAADREGHGLVRPAPRQVALEAEAARAGVAGREHVGQVGVRVETGVVELEGLRVDGLRVGGGGVPLREGRRPGERSSEDCGGGVKSGLRERHRLTSSEALARP